MLFSIPKNIMLILILLGHVFAMEEDRKETIRESLDMYNQKNPTINAFESTLQNSLLMEGDAEQSLTEKINKSNDLYVPVLENEKSIDSGNENEQTFQEVHALEYTGAQENVPSEPCNQKIRRCATSLKNFCCSCKFVFLIMASFLVYRYVYLELAHWMKQNKTNPGSLPLYNGEGYLACPHPVSIVPADMTFWKENGEVCLTASGAKICYDAISKLIEKCTSTSTSSGEETYPNSCTKEDREEIKKTNDAMIAQIDNFAATPTSDYPSGYKLTNGADDRGFKMQFSDDVAESGCVDRCNVPAKTCGTLADIKVHHIYDMEQFRQGGAYYPVKNSWVITFPHLMKYSSKTNQLLDPKITIKYSTGMFFSNAKGFIEEIYKVESNGVTGKIRVMYYSGKEWFRDCNTLGKTSWESRCNPESFWTIKEYIDVRFPMWVEGFLGDMEWFAHSTFENWDPIKNGVTEITGSKHYEVLKNESAGADNHQIKIVNKDSVDPMAIATYFVGKYYNASIKQEYIDEQKKFCDEGKCNTNLRKE